MARDYPLATDDDSEATYPMTDAADGFCAYPSEREDPRLGSEHLGAAPNSPEELEKVCAMARQYEGHRAYPGTPCSTEATCPGCNGVWCKGKITSLLRDEPATDAEGNVEGPNSPEAFPLAKDNETLHTVPMIEAADGFCAYPSERSDPRLGASSLGAAPTSPDEVKKVCAMARQYEGHRAEVGSECATQATCSGCNGVWCMGKMKA